MATDDQLRALYDRMTDSQLAEQKARLGEVTAEAYLEQVVEEAMAQAPGVGDPLPYDDLDATRHARIISEIQDERRADRKLAEDAMNPFSVKPEQDGP